MMFLNFLIMLSAFLFMEGVAWFTHKYVMHGKLWNLHEDHHVHQNRMFQKNDFFALFFAVPGWLGIMLGMLYAINFLVFVGFGITFYGIAYFVVHDIFIHQRFRIFSKSDNFYLRAIRKAHKVHHKHLNKDGAECFGMLLVPFKYFKAEWQSGKMRASNV